MNSKKVTKFDLVESVYLKTKYEKKTIQNVLETLLENIKTSLKENSFRLLRTMLPLSAPVKNLKMLCGNFLFPQKNHEKTYNGHYFSCNRYCVVCLCAAEFLGCRRLAGFVLFCAHSDIYTGKPRRF